MAAQLVSHGILRFIFTVKDADSEEVEQVAASCEPILEDLGIGLNVQYLCIVFRGDSALRR